MNPERWDHLCLRHFAGTISEQEHGELTAALAADPTLGPDLLRRAQEEEALIRHFSRLRIAAAADRRRGSGAPARRRRRIVAMAAAAVLAWLLWLLAGADPPAGAQAPAMAELRCPAGTRVELERNGVASGLDQGAVQVGDRLVVGGDGAATLAYPDGTSLLLAAGLAVDVLEGGGAKRLRIAQGTLSASVASQPRDLPMVIATPHLTATVVGTRFTITVGAGITRLAVGEGTVRADTATGGQSRLIHAGGSLESRDGGFAPSADPPGMDGIAARHAGDRGIDRDPDVLFADGFESGDFRHWDDRDANPDPANRITVDPAEAHSGRHAARLFQAADAGKVADLVRWLDPGRDRIHLRCYVRLPPDATQDALGATPSLGLAAVRRRDLLGSILEPDGSNHFSTSVDLLRNLRLAGIRPGVQAGADGRFDADPIVDLPSPPVRLTPGRWHCLELMLQANRPGFSDGEQRLWLDGVERLQVAGLRLRAEGKLAINAVWITFLVRGVSAPGLVWVDDLVVATRYVGPQVSGSGEAHR